MDSKKYFIGIVVPEPVFEKVEGIKQQLFEKHGLKGALRSPAHITLHRPFEWKEDKEEALIHKLRNFSFVKKFEIQLQNFDFFEPKVIFVDVLPNNGLLELHDSLKNFAKKELKLFNEVEDIRGFHPHVTVALRDLKKPKFYTLKKEFEAKTFSETFSFSDISLLKLEKKWQVRVKFPI